MTRNLHQKPRYVRMKDMSPMVGASTSTLWRWVKDGTFVRPIKLSARITVWNLAEVEQWLEDREDAR